jgi:hypothetical protein
MQFLKPLFGFTASTGALTILMVLLGRCCSAMSVKDGPDEPPS